MTKRLPAQTPRVIHYVDTATRPGGADLTNLPPAVLALALADAMGRQHRQSIERRDQYAAWLLRREEIARHDRKVRRWLLLGVPAGLGLLVGGGWWLAEMTMAAVSTTAVLSGVVVLAVAVVVAGTVGRRCITVVQHWHE
ncbi:hypothetical protein [Dactylosporangium sp. NPDC050588]|uniref:hypothetical protein n=1 Tax=Dactylosporangium sp. NPDC050588 TaxID=3157211 RepID=UPI0033FB6F7B